jgi:hypothetical protein
LRRGRAAGRAGARPPGWRSGPWGVGTGGRVGTGARAVAGGVAAVREAATDYAVDEVTSE